MYSTANEVMTTEIDPLLRPVLSTEPSIPYPAIVFPAFVLIELTRLLERLPPVKFICGNIRHTKSRLVIFIRGLNQHSSTNDDLKIVGAVDTQCPLQ